MRKLPESISVRLRPGDRQNIELAAMYMRMSISEFCRVCCAEGAGVIVEQMGGQRRPGAQLPNLPVEDELDRIERCLKNTLTLWAQSRRGC